MNRTIDIEFNKFPPTPQANLLDKTTNNYAKSLDINLLKLTALYKIEEFDDFSMPTCCTEYPALKYLLPSTDLFKFQIGHPGKGKDSRKENSRVLGQTLCRYFNSEYLDAPYMANISDFIGRKLGNEFNNVRIERKSSGDTPDFIAASNSKSIFLSEAKGRRRIVPFTDNDFDKWREQFDRISIFSSTTEQSLKGYIFEVAIANENNKLSNSKILVEDPYTSGERFESNEDLFNLTKFGHYKRVLQKMGLQFIGDAIIYTEKLNESKYSFPTFTSKKSNKEYVGIFTPNFPFMFDFPFWEFGIREYNQVIKRHSQHFFGIEKTIFKNLISIARGDKEYLNSIEKRKGDFLNESHIEFEDGTLLCNPYLISIEKFEQF
ncbi:hypothetical protein VB776_09870 [Arcicella sp. DC2W]|uniref:Restriction endonuclease n=1 Tax=Arcicella gelida TaxID=2984195 RepID=A0ABU5S458_9BACT|nr:hypothetical protein [Arcicella sp. DC2W]MEA5403221.1 hypothetical protein [Arcicella sp. DC2W]